MNSIGRVKNHGEGPLVSFIVPVFQVEPYLHQCLTSIAGQTYKNIEIILIDDGSQDGGLNICREFADRDDRIQVISRENRGRVNARKTGLLAARGEYIAHVDGDDWIDEEMLQNLLVNENYRSADVIAFSCYEEYQDFRVYRGNFAAPGLYLGRELERIWENLIMDKTFTWGILPHLCDKLIKTEILKARQFQVNEIISYGEDAACVFPCLLDAASVFVTSYAPYHYRQKEMVESGTESFSQRELRALCRNLYQAIDHHRKKENLLPQLRYYIWFLLLLRMYERIGSPMTLFPFSKAEAGMRVGVYGAGKFGRVLTEHVKNSPKLQLAGWADQRFEAYQRAGMRVEAPEHIMGWDFDILVIAVLDGKASEKIKESLANLGVEDRKIDMISPDILDRAKLPEWLKEADGWQR